MPTIESIFRSLSTDDEGAVKSQLLSPFFSAKSYSSHMVVTKIECGMWSGVCCDMSDVTEFVKFRQLSSIFLYM